MQMSQVMDGAHGMWKMKMHFQENIGVATRSRDGKFFNSAAGCSGSNHNLNFIVSIQVGDNSHSTSLFDAGLLDSLWISSRTIPTSPMANDPKWLIIFNIFSIIRKEGKSCSGQGVSTVSCWVVFANFLVITFVNWPRQQQFPPKWPPTWQHLRSEDTRLDRGRVMAAALSMQIYQTRYMETDSDPCKNWIASKTFRFKYIRRIH